MMCTDVTAWALLVAKVDWLQSEFEWIVGGIGIVVTLTIVGIGYLQVVSIRHGSQKDIESLKRELHAEFTKEIDERALAFYHRVDEESEKTLSKASSSIFEAKDDLLKRMKGVEADLARNFAARTEEKEFWTISANWWLTSAALYAELSNTRMLEITKSAGIRALSKLTKGDLGDLQKKLSDIEEYITTIRASYPEVADEVKKALSEKMETLVQENAEAELVIEKQTTTNTPP